MRVFFASLLSCDCCSVLVVFGCCSLVRMGKQATVVVGNALRSSGVIRQSSICSHFLFFGWLSSVSLFVILFPVVLSSGAFWHFWRRNLICSLAKLLLFLLPPPLLRVLVSVLFGDKLRQCQQFTEKCRKVFCLFDCRASLPFVSNPWLSSRF